MSVLDLVQSAIVNIQEKKVSRTTPLSDGGFLGIADRDIEDIILGNKSFDPLEQYKKSPWVYICVKEIINAASSVPLKIFKRNKKTKKTSEIEVGTLPSLLWKVNPWMTRKNLWEATLLYLELRGNCYWELVPKNLNRPISKKNKPVEIYPLRPDRVTIIPDSKKFIKGYVYSVNGKNFGFLPSDIIHLKYFNPNNDYYGQTPIEALRTNIEIEGETLNYNRKFFKNSARPEGLLISEKAIKSDELRRLKKQWNAAHQGVENAYKIAILGNGLDYKSISMSPKDAEFVESTKINNEVLMAAFGVPPIIAGKESVNFAIAKVQERLFWSKTIKPKLDGIAEILNEFLIPLFVDEISNREELFVEFDYSNIPALQEAEEQRLNKIKSMFDRGMISTNQALEFMGFDPVGGIGDCLFMPVNFQCIGKVGDNNISIENNPEENLPASHVRPRQSSSKPRRTDSDGRPKI